MTGDDAYRACEAITRREAKNFSYGIRLLPPAERRALSAVYALARRIDDIGDGADPAPRRLNDLTRVRRELRGLAASGAVESPHDPVMVAVADAARRYALPLAAFDDLLDGCEMDVTGKSYGSMEDLVVYCRRVAGSIGRLSLAVFGCADRSLAEPLADDLGVALQLTNILRDVVEDRERGRVYLPAADLAHFGCAPSLDGSPSTVAAVVAFECQRARSWFGRGLRLLPLLDHRSRACVGAMAGIYYRLLGRIEREPLAVVRGRVSLPGWEKAWVAASSLLSVRPFGHDGAVAVTEAGAGDGPGIGAGAAGPAGVAP